MFFIHLGAASGALSLRAEGVCTIHTYPESVLKNVLTGRKKKGKKR